MCVWEGGDGGLCFSFFVTFVHPFLDHVDWTSNLIIAGDYSNELCTM